MSASANQAFNRGFNTMFQPNKMTLGLFFPLESYAGDVPQMADQEVLAQQVEAAGFSALWFRDVPLRDPSFGDVGQIYDPWVYLSWIAAHTQNIALATGSIVLPLRHPLHVAKAAASVDQLSGGRLVLGVASGDRPVEFPAFNIDRDNRGDIFREHVALLSKALTEDFPQHQSAFGTLSGHADLLPKPVNRLPLLTTGGSQQPIDWIAKNTDGWIFYPRSLDAQAGLIQEWRAAVAKHAPGSFKPFSQSLYIDLSDNPDEAATPIHLGFRCGRHALIEFLGRLADIGVNHVCIVLKYGKRPAAEVIAEMGEYVVPALG